MGSKLKSIKTPITAVGTYDPDLTKAPEGGFTVTARIDVGACIVQVRGWADPLAKEVLGTFTLPVPSGPKAGDMYDTLPVFATYDDIDYNVTSISGGAALTISAVGVGV